MDLALSKLNTLFCISEMENLVLKLFKTWVTDEETDENGFTPGNAFDAVCCIKKLQCDINLTIKISFIQKMLKSFLALAIKPTCPYNTVLMNIL